jgi:hypothetical protein
MMICECFETSLDEMKPYGCVIFQAGGSCENSAAEEASGSIRAIAVGMVPNLAGRAVEAH